MIKEHNTSRIQSTFFSSNIESISSQIVTYNRYNPFRGFNEKVDIRNGTSLPASLATRGRRCGRVSDGQENRNNGVVGQHRKLLLKQLIGSYWHRVFVFQQTLKKEYKEAFCCLTEKACCI